MTMAAVPPVIGDGVPGEYPSHDCGDAGRTAPQKNVSMVAHQRPGVYSFTRLIGNLSLVYDKISPIQVGGGDITPFDSTDDDEMQGTRHVQSYAAWQLSSPLKQDRRLESVAYMYQLLYNLFTTAPTLMME